MAAFRQRLRLLSAAWIVFQVMSLSTLVPRACCLAHQSASASHSGGDEQGAVPHCPTPADESASRPVHHDHGQMHEQAAPTRSTPVHECALRGTCGGPTAALLALLSTDGVLTASVSSTNNFAADGDALPSTPQLIRQFEAPDAPPPRA